MAQHCPFCFCNMVNYPHALPCVVLRDWKETEAKFIFSWAHAVICRQFPAFGQAHPDSCSGSLKDFVKDTMDGHFLYHLAAALQKTNLGWAPTLKNPWMNGQLNATLAHTFAKDYFGFICHSIDLNEGYSVEGALNGDCSMAIKDLLCHLWRNRAKFGLHGIFFTDPIMLMPSAAPQIEQQGVNALETLRRREVDKEEIDGPPGRMYYNYILYDSTNLTNDCTFEEFVRSVFYVGKGKKGRMWDHVADAAKSDGSLFLYKDGIKIGTILEIWKNKGTIGMVMFNEYVSNDKSLCVEDAIIRWLNILELTNIASGSEIIPLNIMDFKHIGIYGLRLAWLAALRQPLVKVTKHDVLN